MLERCDPTGFEFAHRKVRPTIVKVETILALETSCDETAVAILRAGNDLSDCKLLASEIASQISVHQEYGGVVPEVASRNHLLHASHLLDRAIGAAMIDPAEIDAFAATSGPGLASSLVIGASISKGLAVGFGKPYLAINHLEGHLLSPFLSEAEVQPNVSLIVSGGHTLTVHVRAIGDYQVIGRTVDDAAGEAFDKVAKLLGLRYPGGPEIEKHARGGDPARFDFPRSMLNSENFSFSGLKTAVRYLLPKLGGSCCEAPNDEQRRLIAARYNLANKDLADVCASFQEAIVDVLVRKTIAAAKKCKVDLVTISGGVSCNQQLRTRMAEACSREGLKLNSAEPWLCTDNAAMIGFAAILRLKRGLYSDVREEIDPNLALG